MVVDIMKTNEFNWGDCVNVMSSTPKKYSAIGVGSVCGIRVIETQEIADLFSQPIGSIVYLVEGPEGEAVEIPSCFLEKL